MRIAVGGFQHETNTFAPVRATYADFVKHDGWPGLTRGPGLFDAVAGINLPAAGFIAAARADRHDLAPLLWCSAEPNSYVTRDAFERITGAIAEDLRAQGPFDAVYLDLHGAMVVEHHEDGEGEILARVRAVVGPDVLVVASLDFHANLTDEIVAHADALTIYRTYPHLDMEGTGARAYGMLITLLRHGRLAKAYRKLPFLIPLTSQCTDFEPNRGLFARVVAMGGTEVANAEFAEGFPPADIHECGPAVVAYARRQADADAAADELAGAVLAAEGAFSNDMLDADAAVRAAMASAGDRPIVLADAQDNPGAGGTSDTVGLLTAMVRNRAKGAVLAILNDPEVAARAHSGGVGAAFVAALGGRSGQAGQAPFQGRFRVVALGDGRFTCTGEMYRGTRTNLGPMALLRVEAGDSDVRVVVGSNRFQCLDQAIFRHLGVEPKAERLLAVKSTVHFRADFDSIAARTIVVEAPGAHPCRLDGLGYRNLRTGVRLGPNGPAHVRGP
ncbi:MAG: M81 family peptidase [Alphaproteobacteria bacterium]|nr:M81 family peptidase [Alphaproteobacteria bacterium]